MKTNKHNMERDAKSPVGESKTGDMVSACMSVDTSKLEEGLYWRALGLQLVLYTLQGLPMGLASSVPIMLTTANHNNSNINYHLLSMFSLVSWPFSLKLLWAPIVDCVSFERFGRRKFWLVSTQLISSILMICLSDYVDVWMMSENGFMLTSFFGGLFTLMATQDIAVDAWAITMLPKNQAYLASYMNSIGQGIGVYIGKGFYLSVSDFITLGNFSRYAGWVMLAVTVYVIFVPERKTEEEEEDEEYAIFGNTSSTILKNA